MTVIVGIEITVTVELLELKHPLDPVTVYMVVEAGLAVTVAPVVELKPAPLTHV